MLLSQQAEAQDHSRIYQHVMGILLANIVVVAHMAGKLESSRYRRCVGHFRRHICTILWSIATARSSFPPCDLLFCWVQSTTIFDRQRRSTFRLAVASKEQIVDGYQGPRSREFHRRMLAGPRPCGMPTHEEMLTPLYQRIRISPVVEERPRAEDYDGTEHMVPQFPRTWWKIP